MPVNDILVLMAYASTEDSDAQAHLSLHCLHAQSRDMDEKFRLLAP